VGARPLDKAIKHHARGRSSIDIVSEEDLKRLAVRVGCKVNIDA